MKGKLLTMYDLAQRLRVNVDLRLCLTVQRQDSGAAVTANDRNPEALGIGVVAYSMGDESRSPHDIERGNSKEACRIEGALLA